MTAKVLTAKQSKFVVAFVDDELAGGKLSGTEVALRVGYAPKTAAEVASKLLADPRIVNEINARKQWIAEQEAGPGMDARAVLREWVTIATGDPTEIVHARRLCCRYCWGWGHNYQRTDAELAADQAEEMQDALNANRDMNTEMFDGGGGFRITRPPHPECPECDGEGHEDVYIADFRKLTPKQRRLIAGVKQGKHGIEVQFRDQDAALRNLALALGVVVNKTELTGKDGGPIRTANENINYALPTDPVEAARAYQLLMEGK